MRRERNMDVVPSIQNQPKKRSRSAAQDDSADGDAVGYKVPPHYFMPDDIVWIRPAGLPYWPAEVTSSSASMSSVTARLFSPPPETVLRSRARGAALEEDPTMVTASAKRVFYFDKLTTEEALAAEIENRLNRKQHDVAEYENQFVAAVRKANSLVRIPLSPSRLEPFDVCGVGVVHSFMRTHTSAPRQPSTKDFSPQTAVIVLRPGLENAVRDLKGFERIWVVFHFSYAVGLAKQGRDGAEIASGWKTMVVPPRDTVQRGVFATRSPHRPNSIGLSCVRLVDVRGLEVHIADHDLLHGTPVLDIKPYLPFCDAHPDAKAGWVQELDERGAGLGDHRSTTEVPVFVHRNYDTEGPSSAAVKTRHA